jgi:8-oxo-dGTP diphosphatase
MAAYDPNHQPNNDAFIVGQKVVIFNDLGQVLILKRSELSDRPNGWDIPGGQLEHTDQTPEDGLRREVKEETGLEIDQVIPVGVRLHSARTPGRRVLVLGYMARYVGGELILSWEHQSGEWLEPAQALQLDLTEAQREFLTRSLQW